MKPLACHLAFLILFLSNNLAAQNVFPEKFEGCSTDHFALERDTITANLNSEDLVNRLEKHLGEKTFSKLKGKLQLQVIVDLEGNSCLLSLQTM